MPSRMSPGIDRFVPLADPVYGLPAAIEATGIMREIGV